MTKKTRVFIWLATAALSLWLLSSVGMAWKLSSRKRAPFPEPAPPGWTQLQLKTSDQLKIGGWYHEGKPGQPIFLMLHGNGGSRTHTLGHTAWFLNQGYSLELLSLRTHGDSDGTRNDFGRSAKLDVEAAVAELEQRCPGRPIYIQGMSLGAAAAIFSSSNLGDRVAGYVLECPYRDLRTAVRKRTSAYLPIGFDRLASLGLELAAPAFLGEIDSISPLQAITKPTTQPMLFLAGGRDNRAGVDEVQQLAQAAGPKARFEIFPEAKHEGLEAGDPERYHSLVLELCASPASRR